MRNRIDMTSRSPYEPVHLEISIKATSGGETIEFSVPKLFIDSDGEFVVEVIEEEPEIQEFTKVMRSPEQRLSIMIEGRPQGDDSGAWMFLKEATK